MFDKVRRIVTGHDARGRSKVLIEGPPGNVLAAEGRGLAEIWNTDGGPVDTRAAADRAAGAVALHPPPEGTKFRFFAVPPEDPALSPEERERRTAERFEAMGAAHARVDTSRHPSMHRTETVDYIILLSGEVTLLLDEGERDLKPFDVVVQQGTNHGWVNKGSEPALLIAVLIDAELT